MANTPELSLIQPTPLDPATLNVWGTQVNTNMGLLDTSVAGVLTLSVAGSSNVILTVNTGAPDQSRNPMFVFTGLLTGNITIFWPNSLTRNFAVKNNTTGAFTVTLAVNNGGGSPAGTTQTIAQSSSAFYYSDGTNVFQVGASSGLSSIAAYNFLANYTNGSAIPVANALPVFRTQAFQGAGTYTFTTPANTIPTDQFEFTLGGGGGAGGGATSSTANGGNGGGSGRVAVGTFSGFSANQNVTIVLGAGGTGSTGANGGAGNQSTITAAAVAIMTCPGGNGGAVNSGSAAGTWGISGAAATITAGASGLTLVSALNGGSFDGVSGVSNVGGMGGSNCHGVGGAAPFGGSSGLNGNVGVHGGGGSGAISNVTNNKAGGNGGDGFCYVRYVS